MQLKRIIIIIIFCSVEISTQLYPYGSPFYKSCDHDSVMTVIVLHLARCPWYTGFTLCHDPSSL